MKQFKPTALALAASLTAGLAAAQSAAPKQELETVVVTGIRASIESSIKTKRDAATNVEVVTAEDIGKLPDKNIADSLSRLSGLNVTHGSGNAFDEAERIQIRGTPAKLNMITINGHALSSGDWFLGDQNATTRAVGFGMLPSQLIGKAIVYKNGQADINEGGIGGAVDVQTRKPLDLKRALTTELSLGAVHTSLAGKTSPQASALVNWNNAARDFGVLLQVFKEDRELRRDGVENFGVTTLLTQAATDPTKCLTVNGSAICGDANLKGKRLPGNLASALFEGERKREGAFLALQFKPSKDSELSFTGFQSQLKASNYNSNTFTFANNMLAGGAILSNVKVDGDVITGATINPNPARITSTSPGDIAVQSGHQVRDGAKSTAGFYDLDFKVKANERLSFDGRIGVTEGTGRTDASPGLLFRAFNKPITWKINGSDGMDWSVANVSLRDLSQGGWRLITDIQTVFRTKDLDRYANLNAKYDIDNGFLTQARFGWRGNTHRNSKDAIAGAWNFLTTGNGVASQAQMDAQFPLGTLPITNGGFYPANYGAGLSGNFPKDVLRLNREAMLGTLSLMNYDEVLNKDWAGSYIVNETTEAFYAMSDFEHGKLSGNVGARLVNTEVNSIFYQALPANRVCPALAATCPPQTGVPVTNAISSSRRSGYTEQQVTTSHSTILPSLNLRYDVAHGWIGRASASRTMARPEYSELAGAITGQNNLVTPKTASGGNPNLRPTMATNVDASLAWYPSRNTYLQLGVFSQSLQNYVKRGQAIVSLKNSDTQQFEDYLVNSFIGRKAKLKGAEVAGELPLGMGFGIGANATYLDGEDEDKAAVIGTSKFTYNVRAYYEGHGLSASLAWNRRSAYATSYFGNGTITDPSTTAARNGLNYAAAQGSLSASVSYKFNDSLSLQVDGANLLNPTRYYYSVTENMPLGWYKNGRQVFVSAKLRY